jgi:anti-sigma B factor antagonist
VTDSLRWDGMGKLRRHLIDGGAGGDYSTTYDGAGTRVQAVRNGVTHTYSYGAGLLRDSVGNTVYSPGVGQRQNGVDTFFHSDWRGSTRYTTLGDGLTVQAAYRYDAYGNVSAFAGTDTTTLKFAGGHGYQSGALSSGAGRRRRNRSGARRTMACGPLAADPGPPGPRWSFGMHDGVRHLLGKVETAMVEGAPHIRLVGECDMSLVPDLHDHLAAVMGNGQTRIIFDLERVTFLDSSILNIFLLARRSAPDGSEIILLCRPGFVRRLLSLLELDRLVTVCTPEEWRQRTVTLH